MLDDRVTRAHLLDDRVMRARPVHECLVGFVSSRACFRRGVDDRSCVSCLDPSSPVFARALLRKRALPGPWLEAGRLMLLPVEPEARRSVPGPARKYALRVAYADAPSLAPRSLHAASWPATHRVSQYCVQYCTLR